MAGSLRYGSLRRLQVVLGLALLGLVLAPAASRAAPLDTVTVAGDAGGPAGIGTFEYSQISIYASSAPSGQNATGWATFGYDNATGVVGPITCLSVTGPDQGGGTDSGASTTAVLNVNDSVSSSIVTVQMVDHGGNGDTFSTSLSNVANPVPRAPGDCSPFTASLPDPATMMNGRTVVFDASAPTTSATTASFTTNPSPSTVGTQVRFDASSSTCAAAPCTYAWSDGAHRLGSGTPLTFTFHYVGVKHVLLRVTDALGGTASVQHDLWVSRRCLAADRPLGQIANTEAAVDRCVRPDASTRRQKGG